ncbi:MAG: hypothetical protein ACK55Z_13165, partial [bacterium]
SSASLALHSSFSLASRLLCVHVCLPPLHTHQIQGREDPCPVPRGESNRRCCRRLRPWFRVYGLFRLIRSRVEGSDSSTPWVLSSPPRTCTVRRI